MPRAAWLTLVIVANGGLVLVVWTSPWVANGERRAAPIDRTLERPAAEAPVAEAATAVALAMQAPAKAQRRAVAIQPVAHPLRHPSVGCGQWLLENEYAEFSADSPPSLMGARRASDRPAGRGNEAALGEALAWLRWHQSEDGSWDSDGFLSNCGRIEAGGVCDMPGESSRDVGTTGLALLAFLGDGHTTREGLYKEQVARAVKWLKDRQDADSGLYGERVGADFLLDHSIATLAMCEAYYFSRSPLLKRTAQCALDFLARARDPHGAWRGEDPQSGESDISLASWVVLAMKSAEEGRLAIDPQAYVGAASWIDEVTDPSSGRSGQNATAAAILARVFLGQDVSRMPIVGKGAGLIGERKPEWGAQGAADDIDDWYFGSYALFQLGGPSWEAWDAALERALLDNQRHDGDCKGSWDPRNASDNWGGRVGMTAFAALCLEVEYRYTRVPSDEQIRRPR